MAVLLLAALSAQAAADNKVDKLAEECSAGNVKSCRKLADLAKRGDNLNICLAALEKITNQATLIEIARQADYWQVRKAAVEKITDQAALSGVFKKDKDFDVRKAAIGRITDPVVLAETAKNNDEGRDIRRVTIENPALTDQALFIGIAGDEKVDVRLRVAAAGRLADQEQAQRLYVSLIAASDNLTVPDRLEVLRGLTDESVLIEVSKNDKQTTGVRLAALLKLSAQSLREIAALKWALNEFTPLPANPSPPDSYGSSRHDMESITIYNLGPGGPGIQLGNSRLSDSGAATITILPGADVSIGVGGGVSVLDGTIELDMHGELKPVRLKMRNGRVTEILEDAGQLAVVESGEAVEIQFKEWYCPSFSRLAYLLGIMKDVWSLTDRTRIVDIAKNDPDLRARQAAVEVISDPAVLTEFARTDRSWVMRKAAARKLAADDRVRLIVLASEEDVGKQTDPQLLAEIARSGAGRRVRRMAVEKIADQALLQLIAKNDSDGYVREVATEKLTDQTALAEIALCDEDYDVSQAAFKKLTDQAALAGIARSDANRGVRRDAVDKLTDPSVLAEIARNDKDMHVRIAAVKRLGNDHPLARIILASEDDVQKQADQAILAEIARRAEDDNVRKTAVGKLANPALLEEVAKNDESWEIRRSAAERLPLTHRLHRVVLASEEEVRKLADQVLLAEIAVYAEARNSRLAAVNGLTKKALIVGVAKNEKVLDTNIRVAAVRKIDDQAILIEIAKGKAHYDVRRAALKQLTDSAVIADIAKNNADESMRQAAVERLNDSALLDMIICNDENDYVRKAALKRMQDLGK